MACGAEGHSKSPSLPPWLWCHAGRSVVPCGLLILRLLPLVMSRPQPLILHEEAQVKHLWIDHHVTLCIVHVA